MDDDRYGPNYRDEDPETSREAGESVDREAKMVTMLRSYREALVKADLSDVAMDAWIHDPDAMDLAGMTMDRDGIRRRCSDLRKAGFILPLRDFDGKLIKKPSRYTNANRMLCRITEAGLDFLERIDRDKDVVDD